MVRSRAANGAQQNSGRCAPIPARASARRSAEPGLDEGFALVAELEGEEVAALVEGAEKKFVPFPQLLGQELAFRQPHEFAFVAVGERAGEARAGKEMHVLDTPFVGHERDDSAEARIEHGESRFLLHLAHGAFLGAFAVLELPAHANPLVAVFVVLLLGAVQNQIAPILLDVAEGSKSWGVGFHGARIWRTLYHFARHICRAICRRCCCGRANCRNVNLIWPHIVPSLRNAPPPVARRDAQRLPWRRGFQPRCPLNILAYNLTIIPSHCFRYLEFWSIGGLEIQTRSPKLQNSPQRKQSIVAVGTRGA